MIRVAIAAAICSTVPEDGPLLPVHRGDGKRLLRIEAAVLDCLRAICRFGELLWTGALHLRRVRTWGGYFASEIFFSNSSQKAESGFRQYGPHPLVKTPSTSFRSRFQAGPYS